MCASDFDVEREFQALRAQLTVRDDAERGTERTADTPAAHFAPGFADRVMHRVQQQRTPSLADALQPVFRRVASLAAAAVLFIAAFNVYSTRSAQQSLTERVFGLPAVTVASAPGRPAGQPPA